MVLLIFILSMVCFNLAMALLFSIILDCQYISHHLDYGAPAQTPAGFPFNNGWMLFFSLCFGFVFLMVIIVAFIAAAVSSDPYPDRPKLDWRMIFSNPFEKVYVTTIGKLTFVRFGKYLWNSDGTRINIDARYEFKSYVYGCVHEYLSKRDLWWEDAQAMESAAREPDKSTKRLIDWACSNKETTYIIEDRAMRIAWRALQVR